MPHSSEGTASGSRDGRFWRSAVVNVGAGIGMLCILTSLAGAFLGVTPLVFRSGSMAPAIETGALALSRTVPAHNLRVGDVVSVRSPDSDVRITHRIEHIALEGDSASLTLKGDANPVVDATPYVVTSADRVFIDVPLAGYAVAWMGTGLGTVVSGGLVGLVLLLGFLPARSPLTESRRGPAPGRRRKSRPSGGKRRALAAGTVVVALGGTAVAHAPATDWTLAAWSDSATVGSGDFTAYTLGAPSLTCDHQDNTDVVFRWEAVPTATSYSFHYGANGSSTVETTELSVVLEQSSGTAWVVANRAFGDPVVVEWKSTTSQTFDYEYDNGLLGIGSSTDCQPR